MKEIVLESTATSHGIHSILEVAYGCPRKQYLRKQETEYYSDPGVPKEGTFTPKIGLLTGSIGHELLHQYYTGTDIEDVTIVPPDDMCPLTFEKAYDAALRTVRQYVALCSPDEFGKVIAAEEFVELTEPNALDLHPYTCRPDLVVSVTKASAKRLAKGVRQINIPPGVYLVEHKFLASVAGGVPEKYRASTQPTAYLAAWNIAKKRKARGVILNLIAKTKEIQIESPVKFDNSPDELLILQNTVQAAKANGWPIDLDKPHEYACNPEACWSYGSVCRFYSRGICMRY